MPLSEVKLDLPKRSTLTRVWGTVPNILDGQLEGKSLINWSGWRDSNSRHLAPKASALPDCDTPRTLDYISSFAAKNAIDLDSSLFRIGSLGDIVSTIAMAAGLSWASGIRLYAVLFTVGVLGKMGFIALPEHLQLLAANGVLAASGIMLAVEFFADKIPAIDSLWDFIHTFIRIPAGALLAAGTVAHISPEWAFIAAILGGTLTSGSHFTKAGSRALINTSPEPFSNWAASFGEDFMVAGGLWAALFAPVLFLVGLVLFVLLMLWIFPKIWRGVRLVLRHLRDDRKQFQPER